MKNGKIAENNSEDETGLCIEKRKIFFYIFPFIFIGVFVAVYYIFHLHRGRFHGHGNVHLSKKKIIIIFFPPLLISLVQSINNIYFFH